MKRVRWNARPIAEARGIKTATELGELVGVNINTAMAIWGGRSLRVDRETLTKLCEKLECVPGDILVYDDTPQAQQTPSLAAA